MLKMNEDGTCTYYTGTHDMGNGSVTVQSQVVSNTLKIPMILHHHPGGRYRYLSLATGRLLQPRRIRGGQRGQEVFGVGGR